MADWGDFQRGGKDASLTYRVEWRVNRKGPMACLEREHNWSLIKKECQGLTRAKAKSKVKFWRRRKMGHIFDYRIVKETSSAR